MAEVGASDVSAYLAHEIETKGIDILPLSKMTSQGGRIDAKDIEFSIRDINEDTSTVQATVGIFFTEVVINCSCADDPEDRVSSYLELAMSVDKSTTELTFELLS